MTWEPPIGIEPMTYALREACSAASRALPAQMPRIIALTAPAALVLSKDPFHEPFHARRVRHAVLFTARNVTEGTASRAHERPMS